ncbi:MAG: hypothetical protein Kow0069_39000 [Promethearchaeota archaeon]
MNARGGAFLLAIALAFVLPWFVALYFEVYSDEASLYLMGGGLTLGIAILLKPPSRSSRGLRTAVPTVALASFYYLAAASIFGEVRPASFVLSVAGFGVAASLALSPAVSGAPGVPPAGEGPRSSPGEGRVLVLGAAYLAANAWLASLDWSFRYVGPILALAAAVASGPVPPTRAASRVAAGNVSAHRQFRVALEVVLNCSTYAVGAALSAGVLSLVRDRSVFTPHFQVVEFLMVYPAAAVGALGALAFFLPDRVEEVTAVVNAVALLSVPFLAFLAPSLGNGGPIVPYYLFAGLAWAALTVRLGLALERGGGGGPVRATVAFCAALGVLAVVFYSDVNFLEDWGALALPATTLSAAGLAAMALQWVGARPRSRPAREGEVE